MQTIYLQGSEDVQRAASTISSAAESMMRSASVLESASQSFIEAANMLQVSIDQLASIREATETIVR